MRRGLKPRDGGKGRVAILVLDVITDFDFPDGPSVRHALAPRAPDIRRLIDRCRRHRVPIIYVNDCASPWRSDAPALLKQCLDPRLPGAPVVQALRPAEDDLIVFKPRHSAFFGTPLVALLDDADVDTLVIVGISAESCIWMTACDAHTRGFALAIPADTLAGASAPAQRRTLTSLREVLGARVPAKAGSLRFRAGRLVRSS